MEKLTTWYNNIKETHDIVVNKIQINPQELPMFIGGLWGNQLHFAVYQIFHCKNFNEAKKHFYLCGRLYEFKLRQHSDHHHLMYNCLCTSILSDESNLINRIPKLYNKDFEGQIKMGPAVFAQGIQQIIAEDWEALEGSIKIIDKKYLSKTDTQFAFWDKEVFRGFIENDKAKIENSLKEMLVPKVHKSRNRHESTMIFFHFLPWVMPS